jgi:hypothetical protein
LASICRRQNHITCATFLQLPSRGFEDHLAETTFERQRLRRFCEINRLAGQIAAELQTADPLSCLVDGILPAQALIRWRLIALNSPTNNRRRAPVANDVHRPCTSTRGGHFAGWRATCPFFVGDG